MNIYTCYTPSHKHMYWKYFAGSLCFDVSLVSKQLPAIISNVYRDQEWLEIIKHKLEIIIDIINYGIDDIFVFSDVDVQFFGPITDMIMQHICGYDIITQDCTNSRNELSYCTGFMAIRISEEVKNFFYDILKTIEDKPEMDDQDAFNELAKTTKLKIGVFHKDAVWSYGKSWNSNINIVIPNDILVHHANWVFSVESKIAQMKHVINTYSKMHGTEFLSERTLDDIIPTD